ncbi:UNVERIFIED_CONTAM: hypothetical protein GTU68_017178 [Idotea baltica]|nr:hypothetical protein [Idotea baltica]
MTPPALSIENLSIKYADHLVVDGVSLNIEPKKITAIVGPSGCGKSSFISTLNRLSDLIPEAHVRGKIMLNGKTDVLAPSIDLLELRRKIGMVFQKPNPFPLSIKRNFELPMKEHGVAADEISDRMEATLQQVGLWDEVADRLDKSAQKLSGGQQQRLCIARALALSPEIILFDEPCSALDPVASGKVEDHIAELRDQLTVVIVTHNLAQARRISDSTAVFWVRDRVGCIIESGPTKTVFESPGDPDAAAYFSGARG